MVASFFLNQANNPNVGLDPTTEELRNFGDFSAFLQNQRGLPTQQSFINQFQQLAPLASIPEGTLTPTELARLAPFGISPGGSQGIADKSRS